jgi:hypothetical protein
MDPMEFCQILFKEPQIPYFTWENRLFPWASPHPDKFRVIFNCMDISVKKFFK